MLKAAHLGKYRALAVLLTRYGLKDFYIQTETPLHAALEETAEEKPLEPDVAARAAAFVAALKDMGPTYVKFGQVLSTRHDIVPREYLEALEALQNEVEPFPYEEVVRIVESELGTKITNAFDTFDTSPIAAASLAQVHRATMRDGRDVAVKVQRPDIRGTIEEDLQVFAEIAQFLEQHTAVGKKLDLARAVEQGGRMLMGELDFRMEARNIETFRRNLAEFEEIYVPYVIHDFTTQRMLTAEFVRGKKVSKLTPLALIDHDYSALAGSLTRAYLKQVCVDGIWHSDPHPGNVFVHEGRLILLDFGMVSRIGVDLQDEIIKLLLAVTENRGREAAEVCLEIGIPGETFSRDKFIRDITDLVTMYYDADIRQANTGRIIFAMLNVANSNDLKLPGELAMLGKTLLHLDGITRKLDPEFSPDS
jgi:ubiquinone biosynthesis protein